MLLTSRQVKVCTLIVKETDVKKGYLLILKPQSGPTQLTPEGSLCLLTCSWIIKLKCLIVSDEF